MGQVSSRASTVRSGLGSSARPMPGRLRRGSLSPAGRSGFSPFAGGSEELSGVFGGRSNAANRFSSSAMRARAASSCPTTGNSERISASFSAWLSVLRSVSSVTPMLNRVARDRVNHHSQHAKPEPTPPFQPVAVTQVSNYAYPSPLHAIVCFGRVGECCEPETPHPAGRRGERGSSRDEQRSPQTPFSLPARSRLHGDGGRLLCVQGLI